MKLRIIYEDEHILTVYKPAGLAVQTAHVGEPDAVSELKKYLKPKGAAQPPYLGIVHRLDQPVEGVLVFAKNKVAAAKLSEQLAGGILNKKYCAAVCGKPPQKEGSLTDYLLKESASSMARVVTESADKFPEARKAVLHYRLAGQLAEPAAVSFLDIHIETGRFHQIRAQLSHAGMPILGDSKYGNAVSAALSRRLSVHNAALCAYEISFSHPATGRPMRFEIRPAGSIFAGFFKPSCRPDA